MKAGINKPVIFLMILVVALFFQSNWKAAWGWSPEFVMASLIVSVFYLSALETAIIIAAGAFLLNWQPSPGWELFLFLFFPLLAMPAKEILPWKSEVNSVLLSVFSVAAFYAITDSGALVQNLVNFALLLALTACFGFVLFHALNYFYKISAH